MRAAVFLSIVVAVHGFGAEACAWRGLTLGMRRERVIEILGPPLIANSRGPFMRWVYDHGGSVDYYEGTVTAWTAPKMSSARSAARAGTN